MEIKEPVVVMSVDDYKELLAYQELIAWCSQTGVQIDFREQKDPSGAFVSKIVISKDDNRVAYAFEDFLYAVRRFKALYDIQEATKVGENESRIR